VIRLQAAWFTWGVTITWFSDRLDGPVEAPLWFLAGLGMAALVWVIIEGFRA